MQKPRPLEYLTPEFYGFKPEDYDREFVLGTIGMEGFLGVSSPVISLRGIVQRLREVYCGDIGYEYMHIPSRDKSNWLLERIELIADVSSDAFGLQHLK